MTKDATKRKAAPATPKEKKPKPIEKPAISTRHKKRNTESFARFIHIVLKQVHPELAISAKGMRVLDAIVQSDIKNISTQAGNLTRIRGAQTMSQEDVISAVNLLFPHAISKFMQGEISKSVTKYNASFPATTPKPKSKPKPKTQAPTAPAAPLKA